MSHLTPWCEDLRETGNDDSGHSGRAGRKENLVGREELFHSHFVRLVFSKTLIHQISLVSSPTMILYWAVNDCLNFRDPDTVFKIVYPRVSSWNSLPPRKV